MWQWLHSAGIQHTDTTHFGDSIDVVTTAAHAEKLFDTKMHVFEHYESGAKIVRQFGDYNVPDEVAPLVDIVTGLSTFPIPHLQVKRQRKSSGSDYGVVPQTIDSLYQISKEARASLMAAGNQTSQGVVEFAKQNFSPSALHARVHRCFNRLRNVVLFQSALMVLFDCSLCLHGVALLVWSFQRRSFSVQLRRGHLDRARQRLAHRRRQ